MLYLIGIEILFGPGTLWPETHPIELLILGAIIVLGIILFALIRYNLSLQDRIVKARQFFLFKAKQLGLSNFQFKILNGMADMLSLKDPNRIYEEPSLFESSIEQFLNYMKTEGKKYKSANLMFRDIVITHQKLYNPSAYKKPLETMSSIEAGTFLSFSIDENEIFFGKVEGRRDGALKIRLFVKPEAIKNMKGRKVSVFFWRSGDADYTFDALFIGMEDNVIDISVPDEFTRSMPVRLPYIDTIIPCVLTKYSPSAENEDGGDNDENKGVDWETSGRIVKINENEAVVRMPVEIDHKINYIIDFDISDFKLKMQAQILSEMTIHENNVHYYTFRFKETSEAAKNVLKKYIVERL
jgi:hypothetical protein